MAHDAGTRSIILFRLYYLDYPAVVFAFLSFLTGFSQAKFLTLILIILGSGLWQWVVTCVLNLVTYYKFFYFYLLRFRHCSYNLRPLDEYLPDELIAHLLRERLGISRTGYPLGYICIVRRNVVGQRWPATMTTFPFETLPWYIMVTGEAKEFGPHQRFMLLHEIGHTALFHQIATERKLSTVVQAFFFLTVVSLSTAWSNVLAASVVLPVLVWCVLALSHHAPGLLLEQLADRFALHFLDSADVKEMGRENLHEYIPFDESVGYEARSASFEEAVSQRLREERRNSWPEQQQAFNAIAMQHFWPRWYVYLILAVGVSLAAAHVNYGTAWIRSIGSVALVCLPLPILVAILIRNRVENFRQRVNMIMRDGEVNGPLV